MKRILYLYILVLFFTSGCSTNVSKHDIEYNSEIKNIISDEYVNDMRCTNEDIRKILGYGKEYGIENPYIPTKGISTDYIIEIRKNEEGLDIIYPHFNVSESTKKIHPIGKVTETKNVELDIGDGEWIETEGNAPELFLKLDGIYLKIGSAKFFDKTEYEKVAESLVQIKK